MKKLTISALIIVTILCVSCNQKTKVSETRVKTNPQVVLKIKKKVFKVKGSTVEASSTINGDIIFELTGNEENREATLKTLRLTGSTIKTERGESGNISISLDKKSVKTEYDKKNNKIICQFDANIHYPLIDKEKGFIKEETQKGENDNFRSYTEKFSGKLICSLKEFRISEKEETKIEKGAKVDLELSAKERVVGEIDVMKTEFEVDIFIYMFYLKSVINVQPVFIRYTPEDACCCGGSTATTGGSYETLKEYSLDMWNRCCITLNFLSPVYIEDDDYRILSSAESANLRAEYDDPNAIEVFFAEVSDPVGLWGGGACWSGGTANTQIITFDTNLPINLYNLAHELGHALDLSHPPGNSTPGSLMEPSGFCLDNPPYQSDENCDNADNPLLSTQFPYILCSRNTNMP